MSNPIDYPTGLRRAQEILYRLIVAPGGVAEGLAQETALEQGGLATLIAGDDRMTAAERVEIYANSYFYRLLEVLKEDFPATLAIVGADNFHNLATGYLVEYPPTEPSIFYTGRNFGTFLGTHPQSERWTFLGDLARLERAMIESFHAADAPALDGAALRAVAPAQWPALVMRAHPATRLVESAWRVDEAVRAVAAGATIATPAPCGAGVAIVVSRRAARVAYRVAERGEGEALSLALAAPGTTFAALCDAIAREAGGDAAGLPALINRLLARWLDDGVLLSPAP